MLLLQPPIRVLEQRAMARFALIIGAVAPKPCGRRYLTGERITATVADPGNRGAIRPYTSPGL